MSARGILDADMKTLGAWALQGWRWWTDELAALVPARLRRARDDRLPRLFFDGDGLVPPDQAAMPAAGTRVCLAVARRLALVREVEVPAVGARDLRRLLALESDALMPLPAGALVIGGRLLGPAAIPGRLRAEVAGLPLQQAQRALDAAAARGLVVARVVLNGSAEPAIDLTPSLLDLGLIAPSRSATPLIWATVAFLALLNVAVLVWRDAAEVRSLEQLVAAQQPAVQIARTIERRIRADRLLATRSLRLRRRQDALGHLALVSSALPPGAWLQRYGWDGAEVRLAGAAPPRADVGGSLRRSGAFAGIRSESDTGQAPTPLGVPFDVSARLGGR